MQARFRRFLMGGAAFAADHAFGLWPALVIVVAFLVVDQLIEGVSELHSELMALRTALTDADTLRVRYRLEKWLDDPQVTIPGLEERLEDQPSRPRP